eukprot:490252-Alexandrium_andersonii.AAC.1
MQSPAANDVELRPRAVVWGRYKLPVGVCQNRGGRSSSKPPSKHLPFMCRHVPFNPGCQTWWRTCV